MGGRPAFGPEAWIVRHEAAAREVGVTEQQIQEAEVLGKAMRFGAMFSIADPAEAGSLRWLPKKRILELTLTERGKALFGEVAQARFASLALSMKATTRVVTA